MFPELYGSDDFKDAIMRYPIIDNEKFSVSIEDIKDFILHYAKDNRGIFKSRLKIYEMLGAIEDYITTRDPEHLQLMQTMSSCGGIENGVSIVLSSYLPEANIEATFKFDLTIIRNDLWVSCMIDSVLSEYIANRI